MSEEIIEVEPDLEVACKRYGLVQLGDGKHYRAAKLAFGPRGERMREQLDIIADEAKTKPEQIQAFVNLLALSIGVFYSKSIIDEILDNCLFNEEHCTSLIEAIADGFFLGIPEGQ